MKRFTAIILAMLLCCALTGCGNTTTGNGESIHIVTTIFPEYDWVRQILGDRADRADITLLADNGVDLHSFQPTATDMIKISSCDLFIYVGGESDEWVQDALEEAANTDMTVLNLIGVLGNSVKTEEVVEGMQVEEEAEEDEADEHVWLSLRNATLFIQTIADALKKIDADNADTYQANAEQYIEKLNELDADYTAAIQNATQKTVLFADRFPFRYLMDDYGLDYYAAFVGCSAESEASFETVSFLAKKVDELGLKSVVVLENSDRKIADTVIAATTEKNQTVLSLNSLQSIADKNGSDTYLSVMEENLAVLTQALQ